MLADNLFEVRGAGELGIGRTGEEHRGVLARKLGRVYVLTGTASVLRSYALRAVADARGPLLPGPAGTVYDTFALTEDNELTLALKTLGGRMTCPPKCRVTTEIMTSWRDLWRQRLRWHRGALENIAAYGAGDQVHVEDLAAYLAGRERCDARARWQELHPADQLLAADIS